MSEQLRKAVEGMLRIEDIWLPRVANVEHQGEAKALHEARDAMLNALKDTRPSPYSQIEQNYNELIMAVSNKYKGETRHQTALKYITERENINVGDAKSTVCKSNK